MNFKNLPVRIKRRIIRFKNEFLLKSKISHTKTFNLNPEASVVLSILCGKNSFDEGIASVKSLLLYYDNLSINWFSDGTLGETHFSKLRKHFSEIKIITKEEADVKVEKFLKQNNLMNSLKYRREYVIGRRIFDFPLFSGGRRIFQIDSDILFLQRPDYLINLFNDQTKMNYFNEDIRSGYCYPQKKMEQFLGKQILSSVNGGMVLRDGSDKIIHFVESVFQENMELIKQTQREQTLIALYFSKYGGKALPIVYDVLFRHRRKSREAEKDIVSQHYCDWSRPLFYNDFFNLVYPQLR